MYSEQYTYYIYMYYDTGCSDLNRKRVKLKQTDITQFDETQQKLTVNCCCYFSKRFLKSWRDSILVRLTIREGLHKQLTLMLRNFRINALQMVKIHGSYY